MVTLSVFKSPFTCFSFQYVQLTFQFPNSLDNIWIWVNDCVLSLGNKKDLGKYSSGCT